MKAGTVPCPRCGRCQVLSGRLMSFASQSSRLMFQTEITLKDFLHRLLGTKLSIWVREAPYLCVDCGLIWCSVDPRSVQDELHAQDRDDRPGVSMRRDMPVMGDDELDGPF